MKRDMDVIRRIAIEIEKLNGPHGLAQLDGVDEPTFAAHVQWMQEAGLVDAVCELHESKRGLPVRELRTAQQAIAFRLTWAGCEFASAMQDPGVWERAKSIVMKEGASWTFGVLMDWLKAEINKGLPTLGH